MVKAWRPRTGQQEAVALSSTVTYNNKQQLEVGEP